MGRVSILLPTHNRPDVLGLAIRSVRAQTVTDWELLVVGDGCTDDTADVVRSFHDRRILWFDLPKAPHFGYVHRNRVLREARGEFVAFMAHDDLWFADHLALLLDTFHDQRVELAYSRPAWVTPDGRVLPVAFNLDDPEVLDDFLARRRNAIPAACMVFRRSCIERYGGWNEDLSARADWDLWARFIAGGQRGNFSVVPQPTCLHFRADWRTDANAGPPELLARAYAGAACQVGVEGFSSEQAAFWERLAADGRGFAAKVRRGVWLVLDRAVSEQDARTLPVLEELQARQLELSQLRAHLPDEGATVLFGRGCHPQEPGGRWLGREATMTVLAGRPPCRVVLKLACSAAEHYSSFPLFVALRVGGQSPRTVCFTRSEEVREVGIDLDRHASEVRLVSAEAFVPRRLGINGDERELAIRYLGLEPAEIPRAPGGPSC